MTDREPLTIGSVLDSRYRLESVIGEGTFWLTYLATDQETEETVVIKEYLPAVLARRREDGEVEARQEVLRGAFTAGGVRVLKEAAILAKIEHPAIAAVRTAFKQNGTAYIVREYVHGQSFVNWVNSLPRQPSPVEMDRVCGTLLDALETTHAQGIWHLDITPEHVLMRAKDNLPVLIDFGETRAAIACSTRAMHTFVRPGYSPPEQHVFDEAAQGPWTDVYGIAAVMYRAVTGRGPTDVITRNHTDEMQTAVAALAGLYRVKFLKAIDKAMSLDPSRRQQSIAALRSDLFEQVDIPVPLHNKGRKKTPTGASKLISADAKPGQISRWLAPALALVVIAGGLGAFFALRSPSRSTKMPDQAATLVLGSREIDSSADPQLLLKAAETDPAQRERIERRLQEFGFIKIALAGATIWRKPGAGVAFRDCPTCPELAVVPAGSFLMGSPTSEPGRGEDEDDTAGPGGERVAVSLPRPFAIGRYSVTLAEFTDFVRQAGQKIELGCYARYGSWQLFPDLAWHHPGFGQDDRHPVVCVNWDDAQAYVAWLGRKTGQRYRLPTEQEREFATRALVREGIQPRYFFGDDENELCRFANVADLDARAANPDWSVVNCHDGFAETAPVGSFKPNAFGLYDMLGNVWEWTADCFRNSLPRLGDLTTACTSVDQRVLRGGSWRDNGAVVRSAARIASAPNIRDEIVGFRVVRDISP